MPLRSYLKSDEASTVLAGKPFAAYVVCRRYWSMQPERGQEARHRAGGTYLDGIHFTYEGGQIRSLLSLLSYFGTGEMRERSLGIKIPPTNLKPDFGDQATAFANTLADSVAKPRAPDVRRRRDRVRRAVLAVVLSSRRCSVHQRRAPRRRRPSERRPHRNDVRAGRSARARAS